MLILMGIAHANEKRKVGKSTSVEVVIRKRFMHTQTNNKNAMALAYHVHCPKEQSHYQGNALRHCWYLLPLSCHGMQQK
jgi:hypothetical protein